jgi:hypothetical protein
MPHSSTSPTAMNLFLPKPTPGGRSCRQEVSGVENHVGGEIEWRVGDQVLRPPAMYALLKRLIAAKRLIIRLYCGQPCFLAKPFLRLDASPLSESWLPVFAGLDATSWERAQNRKNSPVGIYCQSQKYLLECSGGSDLAKGDEKGEAGGGCESGGKFLGVYALD